MATFTVKYILCGIDPKQNIYLDGSSKIRLIQYPGKVNGMPQFTFDSEDEALAAADGKFLGSFTILKIYHQ